MRIAFLSAAKSIHTIRWVNALAKNGHKVALYSMPEHKAPSDAFVKEVEVHYLKYGGAIGYYLGGRELSKLIKIFSPDVLNAHYATGYGTLARHSKFLPLLLSVWGSDIYDFPFQGFINRHIVIKNIDSATAVASTSNVMAEQVRRVYSKEKQIFITPFGVDTEKFCPALTPHKEGITIGIVKALEPKYGIEYLLRAFSFLLERLTKEERMPHGGLSLEIYGKGSLLKELSALAVELNINNKTHFYGQIEHSQVPMALAEFDIFCVPSDSESFGVAAVEAMACGVPVVSSDADGFCEVMRDGETGFIVARRDATTMANKLYDLVLDSGLRRCMGEAGRAHVKANYDWRHCVDKMEQALEQTVRIYGKA